VVAVGILFVLNSLDSLTRLYTGNLNLGVERLGLAKYVGLNWSVLFGLVLLYRHRIKNRVGGACRYRHLPGRLRIALAKTRTQA